MIGLMVAVSLISVFLIPLSLRILVFAGSKTVLFSTSGIIITIFTSLLFPLFAGFAIRHFAPALTGKYAQTVSRTGQILLVVSV